LNYIYSSPKSLYWSIKNHTC